MGTMSFEQLREIAGLTRTSQRSFKCVYCGMRGREGTSKALYWYERSDYDPVSGHTHTWNHKSDGQKYKCTICHQNFKVLLHEDGVDHKERCPSWGRKGNFRTTWMPVEDKPTPPPADNGPVVSTEQIETAVQDALNRKWQEKAEEEFKNLSETVRAEIRKAVEELSVPTVVEIVDRKTFESQTVSNVHRAFPEVLQALQTGENVYMVGPAGAGKTTIAYMAAEAMGLTYGGIGLSQTRPVSDILGYRDANGNYQDTEFRRVYEHGGVFLFDECDNGNPNTLVLVNEAIDNASMSFPDGRVRKHEDCYILAGANTFGTGADRQYVGRMQLDAAFLDRFTDVVVNYDEVLEDQIVMQHFGDVPTDELVRMINYIRALRQAAASMRLPLVIGTRACRGAARMMRVGVSAEVIIRSRIKKGISDKDWRTLNEGIAY